MSKTSAAAEAFERQLVLIPFNKMLVLRQVDAQAKRNRRYKRVAASIAEVGLVEPLVVCGKPDAEGRYLLLDGHRRRAALMDQGQTETRCLLSRSNEAYTYNAQVNRVGTVQEHLMIVRALKRGVPEERLAKALNVDVQHVKRRVKLIDGICADAVAMLSDRPVNPVTFDALRKMRPHRQVEACGLMTSGSDFSSEYAKALLSGSAEEDLRGGIPRARERRVTAADLALLEREMSRMQQDFRAVELSYGQDMMALAIAGSYLKMLIANRRVSRYLQDNHPETLAKFGSIVFANGDAEAMARPQLTGS